MIACLYVPPAPTSGGEMSLADVARTYSPRVEVQSDQLVLLDLDGLARLFGDAATLGDRLRRSAMEQGHVHVRVALAGTRTAAILLAAARPGVTVVPEGEEAAALAPLPLRTLTSVALSLSPSSSSQAPSRPAKAGRHENTRDSRSPNPQSRIPGRRSLGEGGPNPDGLAVLARWGLRTLGDLAALPAADLSARLGQAGVWWQRLARGEDVEPLAPTAIEEPFEASLELEWPIEGLEPLSFVLTRLLDPLCQRLERRDRGAAVLHVRLRLVTRALHIRSLQLPAPMRDPKVLRTLLLLDLESHPAPAGIDVVTIALDPTPGRIVQESLLARAKPAPEQISTLLARLQALMGEGRCGSPALVDSHRPGAFALEPFVVREDSARIPNPESRIPSVAALRRFRLPIPARVLIDKGHPLSVRTDRQSLQGGRVQASAGPWRTSGEWWEARKAWNRDEWDVALSDGAIYRVFEDRDTGRWFVEAVVD